MDAPTHQLALGTVNLIGRSDVGLFSLNALAQGYDLGSPQPIDVAIRQLLDGSVVNKSGDDNRTVTLQVEISAPSGDGLARGELALAAEVGHRNILSWTPPQPRAAESVFDVVISSMAFAFADTDELMSVRTYLLTLTCLPFARPDAETVTGAVTVGTSGTPAVQTDVDNCGTTTNFIQASGTITTNGFSVTIRRETPT